MNGLKPNSLVSRKGKGVHFYYGEAGNVAGYGVLADETGVELVPLIELDMIPDEVAARRIEAVRTDTPPPTQTTMECLKNLFR